MANEVVGLVLDQFGEPMDYANAYYVNPFTNLYEDGNPGDVSGFSIYGPGMFTLPYIEGGRIAVSFVGYETKLIDVYEPFDGGDVLMLTFNMVAGSDLPEVVIYPDEEKNISWLLLAIVAAVVVSSK